jgi:hypothetical protein
MAQGKQKMMEEMKRDLFSGNDAVVMKALHKCREDGNASMVEPLIALNLSSKSQLIVEETTDMLNNLKVSGTEDAFVNALLNPEWREHRARILSFMWNSGLQPVESMDVITNVAIEGNFEETFECITLLENMEDLIPEEQLLESLTNLREYLNENSGGDRRAMLVDFERLLSQHERTQE